jgi:hypothetical protein
MGGDAHGREAAAMAGFTRDGLPKTPPKTPHGNLPGKVNPDPPMPGC